MPAENPLLSLSGLPAFSSIQPEHMVPAIKTLTQENIDALESQLDALVEPTWASLIVPLEERDDRLSKAWSVVSHLNGVMNSDELRSEHEKCLSILSAYNTQMGQNLRLYEAYRDLRKSAEWSGLNPAQQVSIEHAIRDFKLSGVALDGDKKKRYGEIQSTLSELTSRFSNNVLDATQGWLVHVHDVARLRGLPPAAITAAEHLAEEKNNAGWLFSLDGPVYLTVMTQAEDAELRKEMYTAYATRASDQGPTAGQWDNSQVMDDILDLRLELSQLLGFENYAERSLATKMAESTDQVIHFLRDLSEKTRASAETDLSTLQKWVLEEYGVDTLHMWDVPFYSEKMKEALYSISQETLRPYFTLPAVQAGLFDIASRLFNIQIVEREAVDLWHPDAQFFEIQRDDKPIAYFYMDLFARAHKRGGAWMAECQNRRVINSSTTQIPVAFLSCNFNAPTQSDEPAQLTHNEVTTLFHEFGHGLHHMLTKIDVAAVSGIRGVAWDAVELPSQFLENWCWDADVLKGLTSHVKTKAPLPDELIEKMLISKNFQSSLAMLRQIEFALFDFLLHRDHGKESDKTIQEMLDVIRAEVAVLKPPAFNRFQHGFTHIFAGGYAAGYYSYKWAEVLSADAFSAFEETHLFDAETGQRFLREILEKGGATDAMTLFKNFRGRQPSIEALLRHSGIAA